MAVFITLRMLKPETVGLNSCILGASLSDVSHDAGRNPAQVMGKNMTATHDLDRSKKPNSGYHKDMQATLKKPFSYSKRLTSPTAHLVFISFRLACLRGRACSPAISLIL